MKTMTEDEALAVLRQAGFEPLEPYRGRLTLPWRIRCTLCGDVFERPLAQVKATMARGGRCAHRRLAQAKPPVGRPRYSARDAVRLLRAAGYEPLEKYPGGAGEPWLMECRTCQRQRHLRLSTVLSPQNGKCDHARPGQKPRRPAPRSPKVPREIAEKEAVEAGYALLDGHPYPGATNASWPVLCATCGRPRSINLRRIRGGDRCRHSNYTHRPPTRTKPTRMTGAKK